MWISERDFWTIVHGMGLGALFLLAFAGGFVELLDLRHDHETPLGIRSSIRRLIRGTTLLALVVWLTVITGTYVTYPWYRAKPPEAISWLVLHLRWRLQQVRLRMIYALALVLILLGLTGSFPPIFEAFG